MRLQREGKEEGRVPFAAVGQRLLLRFVLQCSADGGVGRGEGEGKEEHQGVVGGLVELLDVRVRMFVPVCACVCVYVCVCLCVCARGSAALVCVLDNCTPFHLLLMYT